MQLTLTTNETEPVWDIDPATCKPIPRKEEEPTISQSVERIWAERGGLVAETQEEEPSAKETPKATLEAISAAIGAAQVELQSFSVLMSTLSPSDEERAVPEPFFPPGSLTTRAVRPVQQNDAVKALALSVGSLNENAERLKNADSYLQTDKEFWSEVTEYRRSGVLPLVAYGGTGQTLDTVARKIGVAAACAENAPGFRRSAFVPFEELTLATLKKYRFMSISAGGPSMPSLYEVADNKTSIADAIAQSVFDQELMMILVAEARDEKVMPPNAAAQVEYDEQGAPSSIAVSIKDYAFRISMDEIADVESTADAFAGTLLSFVQLSFLKEFEYRRASSHEITFRTQYEALSKTGPSLKLFSRPILPTLILLLYHHTLLKSVLGLAQVAHAEGLFGITFESSVSLDSMEFVASLITESLRSNALLTKVALTCESGAVRRSHTLEVYTLLPRSAPTTEISTRRAPVSLWTQDGTSIALPVVGQIYPFLVQDYKLATMSNGSRR